MPKILIRPEFNSEGGEGGIKRVVEAQLKHLPKFGWDIVQEVENADLVAVHATTWLRGVERKPVVTHCHGLYWSEYSWNKWEYQANEDVTRALLMADAVTAPSQWVANAISRGTWLPVQVLGHGIDLEEWAFLGRDESAPSYVLWNKTRPDPVCDPRPVETIAAMCKDVHFLSTFGSPSANLRKLEVTSHEQHKKVIANAALYLCTTRETFGIGTLEALACGVPIVGWNWGGQAEFITNEVGYLAPVGDYDSLRRGIYHCLEHRAELSANARKLAQSYDWSTVIGRYADLYRRVLEEHKQQKRVSVVVPSHNLGQYLQECLSSVTSQLTANDELIIVDDCSTDDSLEIARNCNDRGADVSLLRTPVNLYLARALNYGIQRAKGRYILPLDADNYLAPGAIELLASQLDQQRDIDIAYGRIRFIDDAGREKTEFGTGGVSSWPPTEFNYSEQMADKNQIPSTSMYRKKVWQRIGGYRARYRTAEDADFWARATSYGARPKLVTEAPMFTYRDRQDSMSNTNKKRSWGAWYKWLEPPFGAPGQHKLVPTNEPAVISVIIPVGPGHGEIVLDALDSVFCQTFSKWECIVVDDAHDIPWLPSWVNYIRTAEPNSGVSVARNLGIAKARGEYFLPLDADDYLEPTALESMYLAMLEAGPQSYVYSDYYRAEEVDPRKIEPFDFSDMLDALRHPITCLFPTAIRRAVKFDESLLCGEDWDYLVGVIKAGYCGMHVPTPLMYYRRTSGVNRKRLVDNMDEVRQKIVSKWGSSLACSCSKGRTSGAKALGAMTSTPLGSAKKEPELVEIEFLGSETATRTYNGKTTGKQYRFGNNQGHKVKYVDSRDAQWFLDRVEFGRATSNQPVGV